MIFVQIAKRNNLLLLTRTNNFCKYFSTYILKTLDEIIIRNSISIFIISVTREHIVKITRMV